MLYGLLLGLTKKQVEEANKIFHSAFAEKYNKDNQHILGDNFNRVTNDIKSIIVNVESDRLVDFGSGTGFILIVAKGMFKELVAVLTGSKNKEIQ